ncbi:MAG: rhodanese-like domain-containing protein [Bacilli bacterium]|jgi:rhodanese-related sulfurtransferase
MYSDISIYRLKSVVDNGILIDIRDEEVFNKGHISKAINIPIYKLLSDPSFYLDEKKTYYIYCANGSSSKYACKMLAQKGYTVFNVVGGYKQWLLEK